MSVFCRALTFISNKFRFFASENAEFYFPFVARRTHNEQIGGREEASFVVSQLCNESSTNVRKNFSFSSFVPCFTLKLVLCFSWKLHVFLSLLHLSTSSYKRERGLMNFKNNLQTHITPNFTQMHIFQFVLFPICICIILNHLSPKIMYIQGKSRCNM